MIEYIRDPLTHMVRNALDHGIEPPDVRRALGKPPVGTVVLRAFHEAGSMVIRVSDDGAGLDRAHRRPGRRAGARPGRRARQRRGGGALVFEPGFSTAEAVTDLSGRGVGMDVVRRNVEALRGSVAIDQRAGRAPRSRSGCRSRSRSSRVQDRGSAETFILPLDAVVECLELPEEEGAAGAPCGSALRGAPLPYLRLRDHFRLGGARRARTSWWSATADTAGVVVDALHGELHGGEAARPDVRRDRRHLGIVHPGQRPRGAHPRRRRAPARDAPPGRPTQRLRRRSGPPGALTQLGGSGRSRSTSRSPCRAGSTASSL